MTISTTANQAIYTGDGASTIFAFPNPFIAPTDLKVYVNGVLQTSGYSAIGISQSGGSGTFANGNVIFNTAPIVGALILIYCDPDQLQSTSLPPNDPFPAKTVEKMIDKLTLLVQRLATKFTNAITAPVGESGTNLTLPSAAVRANSLLSFDSSGNVTSSQPASGTATALAVNLLNSASNILGAAMVGFNSALSYGANTVGAFLNSFALSGGSALIGFLQAGTGAVGRLLQAKLREVTTVTDFGADPTGVADSTAAINAAYAALTSFGKVIFPPGTYKTTSPIVFSQNAVRITTVGYGATINCAHNGNGFTTSTTNESFGGHVFEGLLIQGPNVSYPTAAQLAGTSTGWGIGMQTVGSDAVSGYNTVLRAVTIQGFLYGLYAQAAINTNGSDGSMIRFNQYGIYIDGGQTNANYFSGIQVRENRIAGLYSTGISAPGANATANVFHGCLFETNVPFKSDTWAATGGYNPVFDNSGVGVAVFGLALYSSVFTDCYFENHNYSVWLGVGAAGSSSQNHFNNCRFTPGGAGLVRKSGIKLSGANVDNNVFENCRMISADTTTVNVETDNASQFGNQFINCDGFNFITASLTGPVDVINARQYAGGGMIDALIKAPQGAGWVDSSVGTGRGQISASTGSVTLNAQGCPEIHIGAVTTGAISITAISNLVPLSFFALTHAGSANNITIVSGAMGLGANILLKAATNAVLTATGNMILFWVNKFGQAVEVGRNF